MDNKVRVEFKWISDLDFYRPLQALNSKEEKTVPNTGFRVSVKEVNLLPVATKRAKLMGCFLYELASRSRMFANTIPVLKALFPLP